MNKITTNMCATMGDAIKRGVTSARHAVVCLLVLHMLHPTTAAQIPTSTSTSYSADNSQDVRIDCNSNEISVAVSTLTGAFDGMIYPRGLSKNSSCLSEFVKQPSPVRYRLPLRSCNTMSTQLNDGGVEYFNTIVVQPHRKLVTNQGRGFHIRCRYETRDKTVTNSMDVSLPGATTVTASIPMPACSMRIFSGNPQLHQVAENVKIGDPLTLVVSIDEQDTLGLRVSDCFVRDGLGWGEQRLIDSQGCPVDGEIMGQFVYTDGQSTASVHFQAHKFPYTASVYYQCNVQLCIKIDGACAQPPTVCGGSQATRTRREGGTPATIEVFSGLYVNDVTDSGKSDLTDDVSREKALDDPNSFCVSQRSFAVGIAIAGLVLMLAVVAAILILLARRRRKKDASTTASSIYSGPYTNTVYSHSS